MKTSKRYIFYLFISTFYSMNQIIYLLMLKKTSFCFKIIPLAGPLFSQLFCLRCFAQFPFFVDNKSREAPLNITHTHTHTNIACSPSNGCVAPTTSPAHTAMDAFLAACYGLPCQGEILRRQARRRPSASGSGITLTWKKFLDPAGKNSPRQRPTDHFIVKAVMNFTSHEKRSRHESKINRRELTCV